MSERPSLLLVGHGSRAPEGVDDYWRFARVLQARAPELAVGCGFIELARPDLDTAVDRLVRSGSRSLVAVPLVLLGAGHMKNDGPAALARGRRAHPGVSFAYARALGIHPLVLEVAEDRVRTAVGDHPHRWAVVVVGRGSTDPDANGDLAKVARLLWDSRGPALVEPAFVSLARPSVPEALERCRRLGANRVAVLPYFLFTGILVARIRSQASEWARANPDVEVVHAPYLGPDPRLASVVLERYEEAASGGVAMNCDCCVYRTGLPGYEHRVGQPVALSGHHSHAHDHPHEPVERR